MKKFRYFSWIAVFIVLHNCKKSLSVQTYPDITDLLINGGTSNNAIWGKRFPREIFRGQSQSQYLNFENSGKDGKAEAEATQKGSRATVVGTRGMGQAQSQFSGGDCSGCSTCICDGSESPVPHTRISSEDIAPVRSVTTGNNLLQHREPIATTPGDGSYRPGYYFPPTYENSDYKQKPSATDQRFFPAKKIQEQYPATYSYGRTPEPHGTKTITQEQIRPSPELMDTRIPHQVQPTTSDQKLFPVKKIQEQYPATYSYGRTPEPHGTKTISQEQIRPSPELMDTRIPHLVQPTTGDQKLFPAKKIQEQYPATYSYGRTPEPHGTKTITQEQIRPSPEVIDTRSPQPVSYKDFNKEHLKPGTYIDTPKLTYPAPLDSRQYFNTPQPETVFMGETLPNARQPQLSRQVPGLDFSKQLEATSPDTYKPGYTETSDYYLRQPKPSANITGQRYPLMPSYQPSDFMHSPSAAQAPVGYSVPAQQPSQTQPSRSRDFIDDSLSCRDKTTQIIKVPSEGKDCNGVTIIVGTGGPHQTVYNQYAAPSRNGDTITTEDAQYPSINFRPSDGTPESPSQIDDTRFAPMKPYIRPDQLQHPPQYQPRVPHEEVPTIPRQSPIGDDNFSNVYKPPSLIFTRKGPAEESLMKYGPKESMYPQNTAAADGIKFDFTGQGHIFPKQVEPSRIPTYIDRDHGPRGPSQGDVSSALPTYHGFQQPINGMNQMTSKPGDSDFYVNRYPVPSYSDLDKSKPLQLPSGHARPNGLLYPIGSGQNHLDGRKDYQPFLGSTSSQETPEYTQPPDAFRLSNIPTQGGNYHMGELYPPSYQKPEAPSHLPSDSGKSQFQGYFPSRSPTITNACNGGCGTKPENLEHVGPHVDDSFSQAESSVKDGHAKASAQGKKGGGTAQTQVSGTYSGSGSFSANAMTLDSDRSAKSQVSGNSEGALSQAQGSGGAGKSQSQVQVNSKTGGTMAQSQSGGHFHQSQSEVKASENGGLADAQSSGPGQTSSQAQIGFKPQGDETESENPIFSGGGEASAQSGSHSGQSQSQIQGKFKYGISYHGAAQAASGTKEEVSTYREENKMLFQQISQFENENKFKAGTERTRLTHGPSNSSTDSEDMFSGTDYRVRASKSNDLIKTDTEVSYDEDDDEINYEDEIDYSQEPQENDLRTNETKFFNSSSEARQNGKLANNFSKTTTEIIPDGFKGTANLEQKYRTRHLPSKHYQPQNNSIESNEHQPDSYVTVTKSVTGSIDNSKSPSKGNQNFSSTYYTKTSTCGYFTFSCSIVYGTNGRSKICRPKTSTNGKC